MATFDHLLFMWFGFRLLLVDLSPSPNMEKQKMFMNDKR